MSECLDYSLWCNDHKNILEGLKNKRLLMTYSGGKDSSLVLHFVQKASLDFNFSFETHCLPFPSHVFTKEEKEKLNLYWQRRGVPITWQEVWVPDEALADALAREINPCTVCNQTKKKVLINYFKDKNIKLDQTVIIVNYSLWDLVSATVEHILGGIYKDTAKESRIKGKNLEERFMEISQRFYPMLTINRGLTVFKPLIRYNDQDIQEAVKKLGIPITNTTCRFREYRPKRWFSTYYHAMDLRFDYDSVLKFAKEALHLPDISFFENIDLTKYLGNVF